MRGFYYAEDLWYSEAYQALNTSGRNLLHGLIGKLTWTGKGRRKQYTNNGDVSFSETEFRNKYKCAKATYLRARNKLIEVGLIKREHPGGKCRGDVARYTVLCVGGVLTQHQRWRKYPEENWREEIPKADQSLVGKKTRWGK